MNQSTSTAKRSVPRKDDPTVQLATAAMIRKMAHLGYQRWDVVRDDELATGFPSPYLSFLRHLISTGPNAPCPRAVASVFQKHTWFIIERDDAAFLTAVFKLMHLEFEYKPNIRVDQVLKPGQFAAAKVALVSDVASLLHRREKTAIHDASVCRPSVASASGTKSLITVSACGGENNSSTARGAKFRAEAERIGDMDAQRAAFAMAHRALNRMPRLPSPAAEIQAARSSRHETAETSLGVQCWYCFAHRRPDDENCGACGSLPAHRLRRSDLNAGNVSASSSTSTPTAAAAPPQPSP